MTVSDPGSLVALLGLAAGLGARHALDADHLTVIDGVARRNAAVRPAVARAGGLLFSAGHGAVVIAAAAAAVKLADAWAAPAWLGLSGSLIAGGFLLMLALLNLRAVWATPAHEHVVPLGWKSRLIGGGDHPLGVAAVGALFAVSIDTVAQAGTLGLAGAQIGGLAPALAAAACFALGMTIVGGLNCLWVVRLVRSAGRRALVASRVMTAAVGLLNLAIGALVLAGLVWGGVDRWSEERGLLVSGAVAGVVCLAFAGAMWLGRGSRAPAPTR